jgi:hypothetical protein
MNIEEQRIKSDLISEAMQLRIQYAKARADKYFTNSGSWSHRDRLAYEVGIWRAMYEEILEEVAWDAPEIIEKLTARLERRMEES